MIMQSYLYVGMQFYQIIKHLITIKMTESVGCIMQYCLVMPKQTEIENQAYQFPIGIAYVASSLKYSGRKVITYNLTYKLGTVEELITKLVQENHVDVLMVGGLTAEYRKLKQILDAAKAAKPDVILCVGGGIITASPIPAMEALEVADYGMVGEGEITVCELADALEGKRDIHSVDGLIFKEHGAWTLTAPRAEIMDLDGLPYPDYEGFEFGETVRRKASDMFEWGKDRFGFLSFGRSCPFNCTFCFHPSGSTYRRRSMKSVFQEIDYLIEKFDIRNVYITDELFVPKIEDVRDFCIEIAKRKLGFVIYLRVDMVKREMLELLRDHGCLQVCFGLESADNRILKSMNKHITVEQIDHALALCNEVGLRSQGVFIFGDEAETTETYRNTIQWWKEHPQYNITTRLIALYPGSVLYKNACKRGIIKDEVQFIKEGCPFTNVSHMTQAEYQDMVLEISTLPLPRTDVLKDASIQYAGYGKVNYTARCPECNQFNCWPTQDVFRYLTEITCEHCGHKMHVIVADSIIHHAEEHFQLLKEHKIALWPVIAVVEEMRHAVPSIMGDNVYLVDSAKVKQGGHFYHKLVHSPDIIAEKAIDTVFLTLTTYVASEIIEQIKRFPTVKQVFFVGDLFDPDFPKRLCQGL